MEVPSVDASKKMCQDVTPTVALRSPDSLPLCNRRSFLEVSVKRLCDVLGPVAVIQLTSGAIAGGVSRTVTAPLDRLKVLLQVARSSERISARDAFQRLIVQEGWLSLFRGNGANCLKVVPESALKFLFYDWFKRQIILIFHASQSSNPSFKQHMAVNQFLEAEQTISLSLVEKFLAGSCAGVLAQTIIYPLDVVKTRLTVARPGVYRGIAHCILKTLRYETFRSFYRGYTASLCGMIPYAGVDLACYEALKQRYSIVFTGSEQANLPAYGAMCFGAFSSTLGQFIAYPLALIRTRLQVDGMHGTRPHFMGMKHALHCTIHQEGLKALYRGIGPHLLKSVPAISISWTAYEVCKRFLNDIAILNTHDK